MPPTYNHFWTNFTDKVKHFGAGFLIGAIAYTIFKRFEYCLLIALIAGILKEFYDAYKLKTFQYFDMWDAIWTMFGGGFFILFLRLLRLINYGQF